MTNDRTASLPADAANGESQESTGAAVGDLECVREIADARAAILAEIGKRIVGQRDVIDHLLVSLFARGHCLFVGVPGLAKTLLISTLAEVLRLDFKRIQFTPDLMPSDITGTDVLEEDHTTGRRAIRFIRGPIFTNLLLADEVNRTPPKTQAALLQSMQERTVTAGGQTHPLTPPFLVFATQNPIEQEGTYPLPEAELDRFMLSVDVPYPSADDEMEIVRTTTIGVQPELRKILSPDRIIALQEIILRVPVAPHVLSYAVRLARASRPAEPTAPAKIRDFVSWGAGPRASQYLVLGAKARAILEGRFAASVDDVRALAPAVLRHRIVPNFRAEADGVTTEALVAELLSRVSIES
ncbi:MAG: MoxR family ATPase [Deltaproteobacteria bacterium]|nr:MoxR family ATPase [Deltaproteobacteria bacterium]